MTPAADDSVAKCQERTAMACGVDLCTVQRIVNEAIKSLKTSNCVTLASPSKKHVREKPVTGFDDLDKNLLRRKVFELYQKREYPTVKKPVVIMRDAIGVQGSQTSLIRVLKEMGFIYKKCGDGRKFLMERKDVAGRNQRIVIVNQIGAILVTDNKRGQQFSLYFYVFCLGLLPPFSTLVLLRFPEVL